TFAPMRIVLASPEAVPYAKTGGLADVATALSKALAGAGHEVTLVLPFYPRSPAVQAAPPPLDAGRPIEIPVGGKRQPGRLLQTSLAGTGVRVVMVDQPVYFDRPGLYGENGRDYPDNCERFVFFSRAVIEAVRVLELNPHVIHANDWQTGLLPAVFQIECRWLPGFEETVVIYTIHNLAFQGQFWHWDMELTGLDWKYFNWRQMEHYGHLNLMKSGIVFSDAVTAVSPTYAREIQTKEFGCGLETVLAAHQKKLTGILNGVDTGEWNPRTDAFIARHYSVDDICSGRPHGKSACKADLQRRVGLPEHEGALLVGMISRLTDQKGLDLLAVCGEDLLKHDLQLCFLGSGEARYEQLVGELAARHPDRVAATIGFDEPLAHQIEAGADAFLMPSQYEPCGLNQMYSQMYGTVPIVRRVGGLADTVVDATPENIAAGTATGFCFDKHEPSELVATVERAARTFADRQSWKSLVTAGMRQDWSWDRSARQYVEVYEQALARRGGAITKQ
ncbi:MAG TPA: glycogen synthase GlgA, partial [Planctomycetaceae bacterium]|nr:glycogen synthase GlgA [Planctomycetaceae bacterium]